jgi:hypothetical protein
MFVETGNEELGLVELPDGNFGILPDLLLVTISLESLRHVIGFAGYKPFFYILSDIEFVLSFMSWLSVALQVQVLLSSTYCRYRTAIPPLPSISFVPPVQPSQPSLMFAGKARGYVIKHLSGAPL